MKNWIGYYFQRWHSQNITIAFIGCLMLLCFCTQSPHLLHFFSTKSNWEHVCLSLLFGTPANFLLAPYTHESYGSYRLVTGASNQILTGKLLLWSVSEMVLLLFIVYGKKNNFELVCVTILPETAIPSIATGEKLLIYVSRTISCCCCCWCCQATSINSSKPLSSLATKK